MGLERINELRKQRDMTIEDLSVSAKIPLSTLKKICAGTTTNPALETVKSIARALNCSLDEFDDTTKAPAQQELSKEAYDIAIRFDNMDEPGKALVRRVVDYIATAEQIPLAASAVSHTDAEIAAALRGLTDSQADIPEVQQR